MFCPRLPVVATSLHFAPPAHSTPVFTACQYIKQRFLENFWAVTGVGLPGIGRHALAREPAGLSDHNCRCGSLSIRNRRFVSRMNLIANSSSGKFFVAASARRRYFSTQIVMLVLAALFLLAWRANALGDQATSP